LIAAADGRKASVERRSDCKTSAELVMWPPKQPAGVAYDIAACGFRHSRAAKRQGRRMVYSASAELRRWTVSSFANAAQFAGSRPFESASGVSANSAIVDPQGRVIGQVMTGGIIAPRRYELAAGTILFRWGAKNAAPMDIAQREWWIEKLSFEKLLSFANAYEISVGMATRVLCLVPPEWSDLGTLVRAVTRRPLLAYRGLGNSVVVPMKDELGAVRLPHQNDIAARRLHQLYIPGLAGIDPISGRTELRTDIITVERSWAMDPRAAVAGFLYL